VLIEWADMIDELDLIHDTNRVINIRFEGIGVQSEGRNISIDSNDEYWNKILNQWTDAKKVFENPE